MLLTLCSLHFVHISDGEKLTSGELQDFIRHVIDSGTLQEVGSEVSTPSPDPKDRLRSVMTLSSKAIEKFLSDLSEGTYDSPYPKTKVGDCYQILLISVVLWW